MLIILRSLESYKILVKTLRFVNLDKIIYIGYIKKFIFANITKWVVHVFSET